MAMGMSFHDFMHGDPLQKRYLIKANEIRQRELDATHKMLGWYINQAFEIGALNTAEKKGKTYIKYWEATEQILATDEMREFEKERRAEKEREAEQRAIQQFFNQQKKK